MYSIEQLRDLGYYVWLEDRMIRYRRRVKGPVDETLLNKLLAEIIENREEAIEYLQPVTKEKGPDGKPIFIFNRRNVPPPPEPTEPQQYYLKNHKAELMKLLSDTFVSKEIVLEELRKIKSDKNLASYYIGLLKLKEKERRTFKSNSLKT